MAAGPTPAANYLSPPHRSGRPALLPLPASHSIFTDLLRFSLPLLIVWLIATVLIAKRRQALLTVLEKCYLLVISLVAGVIFEKLAFLGLNRLLEIGKLHQSWAVPGALVKTAGLIAGFFIILTVIELLLVSWFNSS